MYVVYEGAERDGRGVLEKIPEGGGTSLDGGGLVQQGCSVGAVFTASCVSCVGERGRDGNAHCEDREEGGSVFCRHEWTVIVLVDWILVHGLRLIGCVWGWRGEGLVLLLWVDGL